MFNHKSKEMLFIIKAKKQHGYNKYIMEKRIVSRLWLPFTPGNNRGLAVHVEFIVWTSEPIILSSV